MKSGPDTVVASFYPLAFAAEELAPASGPEPDAAGRRAARPRGDARRGAAIREAGHVLLLGDGFQPQLEAAAGKGRNVVYLLDTPGARAPRCGDPHVWLDPIRYSLIVRADRLRSSAVANAAAPKLARLRRLGTGTTAGDLRNCRAARDRHEPRRLRYLAERYGLRAGPDHAASRRKPSRSRPISSGSSTRGGARCDDVYYETLVSPRIAETVARETGAKTAVLDPIEGLTPAEAASGEDYFTRMRANLRTLEEGLGCR